MKIGIVPYLNALPLTHYLPQEDLVKMYPVDLPQALLSGELDCAILPVFSIIKKNLRMHPDAGIIGCDGAVKSVGLFTRSYIQDIGQIGSIYMDVESLSSTYLTKIILKKFYNISLYDLEFFHYDNRERADAQLLIGDKALYASGSCRPYQFWDVGEIWKQHTDTGFMFATWASKRALSPAEINVLKKAKQQGLKDINAIVKSIKHDNPEMVKDYLNNNIIYEPTKEIKNGLKLYKDYLKEYHYSEPLELKVA